MCIPTLKLYADQVSYNLIHQSFSLMCAADCHTAECVAKTASGSNDVHLIIIHTAGVVKICIPADTFCKEQFVYLLVCQNVRWADLRDYIIRHKILLINIIGLPFEFDRKSVSITKTFYHELQKSKE